MRGLRRAGLGAGIVASLWGATEGAAQAPPAHLPAVRIARVRPAADDAPLARAQATGAPQPPPVVGTPQPLPTGPSVTAEPGGTPATGPAVGMPLGAPPPYTAYPPTVGVQPPPQYAYPNGVPSTYSGGLIPVPAGGPLPPPVTPAAPGGTPVMMSGPAPALTGPLYANAIGPASLLAGPWGNLAGQPGRWSANADLLLWWVKPASVPALVTSSSPQFNGVPGQGDTRVLFGGGNLPTSMHTGGRFGGVYWFDDNHTWGIDGNLFFLGRNGKAFTAATDQYPLLARPFFNANQNVPFSEIVAAPGLATGAVAVEYGTQMWGADVNFRRSLLATCCSKFDIFAGYRYLRLTDDITVTESFARTPGSSVVTGVPTALVGTVSDSFSSANNFHGVNLGITGELRRGRWTLDGRASIALGTVFQTLTVSGTQEIQYADGSRRATGGLLALPGGNIGTFGQNRFGAVTEAGLKLSYDLTTHWKLGVGYNFLYVNDVVRAPQQIDPVLDVNRIPNFPLTPDAPKLTSVRPHVPFRTTDVFAQGVVFSAQYTW
jgi:hypothetical protein